MKSVAMLMVVLWLPLFKGHDFASTGCKEQCLTGHPVQYSSSQMDQVITVPQQPLLIQDCIIDDDSDDNDEFSLHTKGHALIKSMRLSGRSCLIDIAHTIKRSSVYQQRFLISCYAKYICARALRI